MQTYTVTFHHAHNVGAMLQSYALQQALQHLGFENSIIDYSKDKISIFAKGISKRSIKTNLIRIQHYTEYRESYNKFEKFYKNNLKKTEKYKNLNDLWMARDRFKNIIVGSDQVWRYNGNTLLEPFFSLEFAPDDAILSGYAISLGGNYDLTSKQLQQLKNIVSRFKQLSFREESACRFVRNQLRVDSVCNIDPVFLLDKEQWENLADQADIKPTEEDYILCFELLRNDKMQSILDKIKRETNKKVVVATQVLDTALNADKVIRNFGPLEFLSLIKHSSIVVTTSFHGTAFGILLNKPTISLLTHAPERVCSLLNLFGMEPCAISDVSEVDRAMMIKPEYKSIERIRQFEASRSLKYLASMFEDGEKKDGIKDFKFN